MSSFVGMNRSTESDHIVRQVMGLILLNDPLSPTTFTCLL